MFTRLKAKAAKTDGINLIGGTLGRSTADIDTVLFTDVYTNDYSGTKIRPLLPSGGSKFRSRIENRKRAEGNFRALCFR